MADGSIDILMRAVGSRNNVFPGDAQTQFAVNTTVDRLRYNFAPGLFSELRAFSFSAGIESSLYTKEELEKKKAGGAATEQPKSTASGLNDRKQVPPAPVTRASTRAKSDFVDMQPVEFTRTMDSASPLFFKALAESETLASLSVVKRKASGAAASGLCYLRLDFTHVLMTDLAWKDEHHLMVETGTFIYRSVKISYARQNPDGSLDAAVTADWTMKTGR